MFTPNFDRSGWLDGLQLIPDLDLRTVLARDPPSNLTEDQKFQWSETIHNCLEELFKQGRIDEAEKCLQSL